MSRPLSNVQAEILQTFKYRLSEEELLSFKQMLTDYFAEKISDDVDRLFSEKGWDEKKADDWANEHMRTSYKEKSFLNY